jgi:membrane-associated HD superfamily phosphohydrolase
MLHITKFMIRLVGLHLHLPTLHNLLVLLCNSSNMLNILLILRSVCDVIVVANMVIVNEKRRNPMMLIKHIKLFLPFLMDLFLLLILFSIAHMLHMPLFLPMMIPSMLSMMLLNTRHTIMLGNPIQVGSNHIVLCWRHLCSLWIAQSMGALHFEERVQHFLLSIDQAID